MKNHPIYFSRFAAMGLCLSMLSLSSCDLIEMRDSYEEVEKGESDAAMMLAPAERKNEIEVRTEEPKPAEKTTFSYVEESPKTVVKFAAAGDVRIDESIIADAANRAAEGSTYSFLKMYSGIYRDIHDADVAVGAYSTAAAPYHCEDDQQTTPVESLVALSELGFDVLDTTGTAGTASRYSDDMTGYGIGNISSAKTGDDAVYTVEEGGITVSFLSTDGSREEALLKNLEYADFVSDVIVVSVNWEDGASETMKKDLAGSLAQAGADIILGSGDTLGGAEWIDSGDGTKTLAVYSLGNFAATADLQAGETAENLCGGILSLDITLCEGEIALENVCIDPIIMHYSEGNRNYQIFKLKSYTSDISATHAVEGLDVAALQENAGSVISSEFLPSDFQN